MNNKIRILSLVLLGLLIASLIFRSSDIVWLMMPFLIYLGAGIFLTPDRDRLKFTASREISQTRNEGRVSLENTLNIRNESGIPLNLWMGENDNQGCKPDNGYCGQWIYLKPDESSNLTYSFYTNRGNFAWEKIRIKAGDPFDLFETELSISAPADIQVRPMIRTFKPVSLRPRSTLHAPGSIPARIGGTGTDFYGVREYHAGDPLRSLDWRLTARHPNKFFTKEFEQEEIAEVGIILNARQNVELKAGEDSLFEHSINAAASLAEMFLHQGHRLSLLVFGKRMSIVFPGYGKTQLHRVMSCLSKAEVEYSEHASTHMDFLPIRMFPGGSVIIVISPLASGDLSLYKKLRANGYQVYLISPDSIDFAGPDLNSDRLTKLAVRTIRIERRLQLDAISQLHIPVIDWKVNEPLFPLVRGVFTHSRGQRER